MVVFPDCKINLGLNILDKREDGFHNLETVFYPVPLNDVLEVVRDEDARATAISFTQSGLIVDGNPSDNLCVKAYQLLKNDFPSLPPVKMHLHKAIPMGAGLGGGSADGAFTLKILNDKFGLALSQEALIRYALMLGSDCPFFILNQPCFATGRGEVMHPVNISLKGYQLLLINPGIHVNTGWAFGQLKNEPAINRSSKQLEQCIQKPISVWKEFICNDFELPVFNAYPELASIKQLLYENGALYAAMSGSGSTLFGIFDTKPGPSLSLPSTWMQRRVAL